MNLTSTISLIQALLPLLRTAAASGDRGARVILLSSIAGRYAEAGLAVYGSSKAAVASLAGALNTEASGGGVTFTAIAPAYVDTDMSAWTTDRIPAEEMIPVDDDISVVRILLDWAAAPRSPRSCSPAAAPTPTRRSPELATWASST